MNKVIVGIIVVIILAAGGWVWHDHKNSSNNSNSSTTGMNMNSGSSSSTNSGGNSSDQSNGDKVSIQNMMFTPSQITIQKGDTVTWTNNDSITHTVTSDDGKTFDSGDVAPGKTFSFTFDTTGSFQYHCTIHPSMRGTIVVR